MTELVTARRGDIAVIKSVHSVYTTSAQAPAGHYTEEAKYSVCEVTSITRTGVVKAVRPVYPNSVSIPLARWTGYVQTYIVPAARIDVAAALAAARRHTWPGHPEQPKDYDSLAEVRGVLRSHLIETTIMPES